MARCAALFSWGALCQTDAAFHEANEGSQGDIVRGAAEIMPAERTSDAFNKAGRFEIADYFF
jgi:hypothetical protein